MKDLFLQEFTDTLDGIIEYFPHQPQWQNLKQNFIREYSAYRNIYKSSDTANKCRCCGIRESVDEDVFCRECLVFFSRRSSDIVIGKCDCGHLPQGPDIFLFNPYGRLNSLCSIKCVKEYYQNLFGPLLRMLK